MTTRRSPHAGFMQWRKLTWAWLATGGVLIGLTIGDVLRWPVWVLVLGFIVSVLIAQWRAWEHMRSERDTAYIAIRDHEERLHGVKVRIEARSAEIQQ